MNIAEHRLQTQSAVSSEQFGEDFLGEIFSAGSGALL
jgi:hypothetical protein